MNKGQKAQSGKQRWECKDGSAGRAHCYSTTNPNPKGEISRTGKRKKTPIFKRKLGRGVQRFVITAAQNATPVHRPFLSALEVFCAEKNAELIVIPLRYKNPTSRWTESQANEEVWANEVQASLCNERKRLNRNLIVVGDTKVQPTAAKPLTGFDAVSHGESCIIGHPKLQLRVVPTPQRRYPKVLTTTGVCTVPNFTDSRAGKLAEFHYTLGAALVELDGGTFHLRQINAQKTSGEFIDIRTHYSAQGSRPAGRAQGLIMGDTHRDFISPRVEKATFGPGGMVEVLDPEHLVWHDVCDSYSANPHTKDDPFVATARVENDRWSVRAEVERACLYVIEKTPKNCTSIIVPSNHPEWISRWIKDQDWKKMPGDNGDFYLETALAMRRSVKMTSRGTEYVDAFNYWARKLFGGCPNIKVLDRGDSYAIAGIQIALHFDKGPNGSRGSLQNLRRIGEKVMGGHGHGPGIDEGGTQVGTSTDELEYGRGSPSSWLTTHGGIDALGKRCLYNVIEDTWRL